MKKTISLLLVIAMMMVLVPTAHADPTNGVPFNVFYVFGGPSQEICSNTCTCITYCLFDLTSVNLYYSQSHISFRPYVRTNNYDYKLCSSPKTISSPPSGNNMRCGYDLNTHLLSLGSNIRMRASIPSINSNYYCTFSGYIYF